MAVTWADMRPGHTDKDKREMIRSSAATMLSHPIPAVESWAFRIFVRKSGRRPFDIENTLKIIIDSFSRRQIRRDRSQHERVALYEDDTLEHVGLIQVGGERCAMGHSLTRVEIFAKIESNNPMQPTAAHNG